MTAEQLPLGLDTPMPPRLPDQDDRDLITRGIERSLFIDAGAGSGKTSALVGRVVHLVGQLGVPLTAIVAITFTEKAAAELRDRIRHELRSAGVPADDLDEAPIGTLHAFARRMLAEFPTEVGLPPRFGVLDEVQSALAFDERFDAFARATFDDIDSMRLVQLCSFDNYQPVRDLRRLAAGFQDNWDLVAERVDPTPPTPVTLDLSPLATLAESLATTAVCDGSRNRGAELLTAVGRLRSDVVDDHIAALVAVAGMKWARCGNAATWKKATGDPESLGTWRADGERLSATARTELQRLREERRRWIGALLHRFTLDSAAARCRDGRLEFHDLLVLARRLLRHHPEVRGLLHQRWRYVFLDEFQDTDPIQLELALRLTAPPTDDPADWRSLQPLPGRLCVVGDPKQSIYRFRRADIGAYLRAQRDLDTVPATLSSNFRSSAAVIGWVNATMARLIVAEPDAQPDYVALTAQREAGRDLGTVHVLGAEAHEEALDAEALRVAEADDVAAVVVRALGDAWPVVDRSTGTPLIRPCRLGDICILLPARTSLSVLESALAARNIPYRAENSSLVYATDTVRALLLALRAIDDPSDELAVVSTLRTSLFGCSDRDLADWRVVHGQRFRWRAGSDSTAPADHPVGESLALLAELREHASWASPAQLLTELVDRRMVLEVAATQPDGRDVWRRVRFVIDQARAWSDSGGSGLRQYLDWVRLQGEDGRFVAETVLPDTDHDAVRIMTVHAAKGLEFPITIVSGLTTQATARPGKSVLWTNDSWVVNDTGDLEYQAVLPVDEQLSRSERIRLWYVACTRACDHLVVSTHRVAGARRETAASILAEAAQDAGHLPFVADDAVLPLSAVQLLPTDDTDEHEWSHQRRTLLQSAARQRVVSATSLATQFLDDAGLDKAPVDVDLPPWQRGRYGTQVGRAVHAVLQHADLRHGTDVEGLAAAQAAAEGVLGLEGRIAALARSALATEIVAAALDGEHWRELFVATAFGDVVVEGYIDLLVRRPDGSLVVVDYKTDRIPDGADAPARLAQYSMQLAAYGLALERLLGERVSGAVLVMCRQDGPATEIVIDDWRALCDELGARLLAGPVPATSGAGAAAVDQPAVGP